MCDQINAAYESLKEFNDSERYKKEWVKINELAKKNSALHNALQTVYVIYNLSKDKDD